MTRVAMLGLLLVGSCRNASHPEPGRPSSQAATETAPATRVLFVGNSYTFYNRLPQLVGAFATANGRDFDVEEATLPGATLAAHLAADTMQTIARGEFAYVVLQGQSMRPINDADPLIADATEIAARIRAAGAEPILFETWARRGASTQPAISATYRQAASKAKASVAAVGEAFARARQLEPTMELYSDDGSHPSPLGSYLAACVLWRAISGASTAESAVKRVSATDGHSPPRDVTISDADAARLHRVCAASSSKLSR